MRKVYRRDFGVKGMKKGQHKMEKEQAVPAKINKKRALKSAAKAVGTAAAGGAILGAASVIPKAIKAHKAIGNAAKALSATRGQTTALKGAIGLASGLHAAERGVKGGLIGGALGLGALGAVALAQHMRNKKKARKDSIRKYRDSQRKLIIAKRKYRDALNRYRDAEENALKAKFNAIMSKVKNTIKEYIKAFPNLSRLLSLVLVIDSIGNTYGVVAGAPKVIKGFDKIFKEIDNANLSSYGKAGLKVRGVLYALFIALKQVVKAIIKFKAAKGIAGVLNEK